MSEQPSAGSLADRITKPVIDSAAAAAPSKTSWADETASPVNPPKPADESSVPEAQVDGATPDQQGSQLVEAEYDVELKLSDLQGNVNDPLFSVNSFEQLGM